MTVAIGIDPGVTGALARLDGERLAIRDMPTIAGRIDPWALCALLAEWGTVDRVVIETQQAYPGQGVSSSFQTGVGYGLILGVLAALERPVQTVTGHQWTSGLHLPKAADKKAAKEARRLRCKQLWPHYADLWARRKDDGRADAALIAWWATTHPTLSHQPPSAAPWADTIDTGNIRTTSNPRGGHP